MRTAMAVAGWALRACAAICIVWVFVQVLAGALTILPAILSSVAWHAGFALAGTGLVGASRAEKVAGEESPAV